MKKPGTPAIPDCNAGDSPGVSADGDTAFCLARAAAEDSLVAGELPAGAPFPFPFACAGPGEPAGLLPCDSWACTCGAAGSDGGALGDAGCSAAVPQVQAQL